MEPRVSLITLGVSDLARSVAFYRDVVGWSLESSPPGVAFFDLGGLVLSLFPHSDLQADTGIAESAGGPYRGFTLAHNGRSIEEVDRIFASLRAKGAEIVKEPQRAEWGGYSGYFRDPDGHVWEVAFNPHWTVLADGRISMRKR